VIGKKNTDPNAKPQKGTPVTTRKTTGTVAKSKPRQSN
jgi:hypothetical protein